MSGGSHARRTFDDLKGVSSLRLRRVLKVSALRREGRGSMAAAEVLKISLSTARNDYQIFLDVGDDAIRAELAARVAAPANPKKPKPGCAYLVPSEGRVTQCGKRCRGTYCRAHQAATMPAGFSAGAIPERGERT